MKTWLEREKREREKDGKKLTIISSSMIPMEFEVDEIHLDFMKCHLTTPKGGIADYPVALIPLEDSSRVIWVKTEQIPAETSS
jgi:hypothetical protein